MRRVWVNGQQSVQQVSRFAAYNTSRYRVLCYRVVAIFFCSGQGTRLNFFSENVVVNDTVLKAQALIEYFCQLKKSKTSVNEPIVSAPSLCKCIPFFDQKCAYAIAPCSIQHYCSK